MAGRRRICVIGGVNVDIAGLPDAKLIPGDSNPGSVSLSLGGVGRNIAESISRLGADVSLVTLLGDDLYADWIRNGCDRAAIDLSLSGVLKGMPSGIYLCVNDEHGNLTAAVSDMRLCDAISPAFLASRLAMINAFEAVVIDANLPAATIRWLADYVKVPIAADPVSVKKADRLQDVLPALTLRKPNLPEAMKLLQSDEPEKEPVAFAEELAAAGVQNVMLTMGSRGAFYANAHISGHQPCLTGTIVSTNGCGDAALSASLMALLEGRDLREAALIGQAASSICARSPKAVNPEMTWDAVCELAFQHQS